MKKYKLFHQSAFILAAFLFALFALPKQSYAVTCTSAATGNWNATGTWTGCTGGNGSVANTPGSNDTAIITLNHTVTLTGNETVNNLQFSAAANAAVLKVNSSVALTVSTAITVLGNLGAATSATIQDGTGAGTVTAPTITVGITGTSTLNSSVATTFISTVTNFNVNGAFNTSCQTNGAGNRKNTTTINLNGGTTTVTGTLTLCGTGQGAQFSLAGTNASLITSAATPWSITAPGSATLNGTGSTVEYSGAGQAILVSAYTNLTLSGSGSPTGAVTTVNGNLTTSGTVTYTTGANLTVGGNLTVGANTSLTTGTNFTLAVSGTTGVSGTLANANTGGKTYTGLVTINSGGSFTNANDSSLTFQGGFTNNSTGTVSFGTSGTTVTFNTNSQALGGNQNITFGATTSITGAITVTNNNTATVTFSGAINGSVSGSTYTQGANSYTVFAGSVMSTGALDASTNTPNTVEYSGSSQAVETPTSAYYNLTISGSSVNADSLTFTINNTLSVTGTFTVSAGTGTITAQGDISGTGTVTQTFGTFTQSISTGHTFGPTGTNDWTFNNLNFSASSGTPTVTTSSTSTGEIVVGANLTVGASTTLDAGNRTWKLTATGSPFTLTGSLTANTSTFNYEGSSIGVTVTGASYYKLGVGTNPDATPTTFTLGGNTTVTNTLTVGDSGSSANDTLDGSSKTLTLTATGTPFNLTVNGLFSASTSSVVFSGTSAGVNIPSTSYYDLSVGTTGDSNTVSYTLAGNTTVGDVLTIGASSGTGTHSLDASSRTLTLSGTTGTPMSLGTKGSFTPSTSTVIYSGDNAGGNTSLANVTYYNLTCNNASETYSPSATLSVTSNLTLTAGTLDLGTNSMNVGSSSVTNSGGISNSGTIAQSSSGTTTIVSSSAGAASIGGSGTTTLYNLTFAPTVASAPTFTLGTGASQTITVSNNLNIGNGTNSVIITANTNSPTVTVGGIFTVNSNGTFTAPPSANFSVGGNVTNNGTFNNNGGTVTITGSGTSTFAGSGSPAITFNNFTANTASKTLNFTAGETFRINGLLTLAGQTIDSTTASQWFINHQGTESVTNSTITNSGCDGTSTFITVDITDTNGGNNGTCWDFASIIYPDPVRMKGSARIKGSVRIKN